uniref:DNA-directed RNA polymerase subunit beta n=1 Tax=Rhizochromulina marina TaxID=1034831 RepID=A0A514CPZ8_9STRA|nr:RNA polymerase beta subunit [Rhizochromulina marina]QDH81875.1 RNA polymerase beta subunit [Rhizochromulina marina]
MQKKAFLTTLPDFVEIQRSSFCWFLLHGLREELENFSTISDLTRTIELNIFGEDYRIRKPSFSIAESKQRDGTYSVQIYVPMSIFVFNRNSLNKRVNVLIGEIPLMTDRGTFVINGCERVVINQILRSPGVYFKEDSTRKGESIYTATVVPNRGSWLKFELNTKKQILIYLDKTEKTSLSDFLSALGMNIADLRSSLTYPEFFQLLSTRTEKLKRDSTSSLGFFDSRIFDPKIYDIGLVGRYKLNKTFNLNLPADLTTLTNQDFTAILNKLICLNYKDAEFDDIDHLQNRRVRSVGELLQIQFRSGLTRLERILSERMTICDPNVLRVTTLVNPKPIISMMREFFGSSQLSQFLDQTNPLAELTHKRRISGLGPGGFSRDHVSFTVRDIHPSHYGRVCPIETPEGQNAGLIASLASYARVNSFGFIETPFFQVKNGFVLKNYPAIYLTADEERQLKIAPADLVLDLQNKIQQDNVTVRFQEELEIVPVTEVELMAVSAIQIVSAATALIPFLEHDDANRALMGSNMQRQAVPLLYPTKPIVGTGLETQLAADTGMVVITYSDGVVNTVTNSMILVRNGFGKVISYALHKYMRSNQDTCVNQRPIVWEHEEVKSGQIIADGPGTDMGELALGQNILVAYMPWEGYNFEDALLVNERLVFADLFTSIHIEKYDLEVRETKVGLEQLSSDIPNVSKKSLLHLDENGIVKKGTFVTAGDILVGKVTPREEADEIPEGRLLRAIFGEKNLGMIDNSLRVPNGSYGRVLDIRVFSRENGDDLPAYTDSLVRVFLAQMRKIQVGDKIAGRHGNKGIISRILPRQDMPFLPDGTAIDLILNPLGVPSRMNVGQLFEGLFGLAGDCLNVRFKLQPFDEMYGPEASRTLINQTLKSASCLKSFPWLMNFNAPGKLNLCDGRTGQYFDNPLTVCKSYILKLVHLVDDKIHARSTGPYSLVTQQPLGGRSQQGGQRFGEMEVWALEAFGAAYTLQELLTIKSDDMPGRNSALNAIVKGEKIPKPGIPESFKVLILELQSLGLDIGTYQIHENAFGQLNGIEIDLMERAQFNSNVVLPTYQSLEIL